MRMKRKGKKKIREREPDIESREDEVHRFEQDSRKIQP